MVWSLRGKGYCAAKKESLPFRKREMISRLEFLHRTGKLEPCTQFESVWTYFPGGMIFLPAHLSIMRNETIIYIQETALYFKVPETIPWLQVRVFKNLLDSMLWVVSFVWQWRGFLCSTQQHLEGVHFDNSSATPLSVGIVETHFLCFFVCRPWLCEFCSMKGILSKSLLSSSS